MVEINQPSERGTPDVGEQTHTSRPADASGDGELVLIVNLAETRSQNPKPMTTTKNFLFLRFSIFFIRVFYFIFAV